MVLSARTHRYDQPEGYARQRRRVRAQTKAPSWPTISWGTWATLSSAIIALALTAQLSGLGFAFRGFALVLLPVVFFLGG